MQRDDGLNWIRDGLAKPGKTQTGLAAALGRKPSAVTALLQGERDLKVREVPIVAKYLEVEPPGGTARAEVPIVGYVGAGAEAHFYAEAQGPIDYVESPDGATESTVAVIVRGTSLGELFDSWLVFYDDVRSPVTNDLIGKLCVVGLTDGRVLVKKLQRSKSPGLYHLISNTEGAITDVGLDWAAMVTNMVPR